VLQAFFFMVQARYAMGAHRIESSQFQSHLRASVLIKTGPTVEGQPHFSITSTESSKQSVVDCKRSSAGDLDNITQPQDSKDGAF
jgi:hypothetical protein